MEETAIQEEISEYEKERGKPMPSLNHGLLEVRLGVALSKASNFTVGIEITLALKPKATPDISIFPKRKIDWQRDETPVTEMPLTVIEILSPSQGIDKFAEKLAPYFAAGIKSVWLVQSFLKTIAVFLPDGKSQVYVSGNLHDEATGITLNLDEVFE